MEFKHTLDSLIGDIKELEAIVSSFRGYEDIPQIEIDLAMEKMRKAYDVLFLLNKEMGTLTEETPQSKVTEKEKSLPETGLKEELMDEVEIKEEKQPRETVFDEGEKEEKEEKVEPVIKVEAKKQPKETDPGILADKYKGSKHFMDEKLHKTHNPSDVSARMQLKPLEDINKAIGINDRFLFINELFQGDSNLYKKTLDRLNNAANFNDAFNYINDHLDWDMENEHVQKILDLIRRKFISPKDG